MITDEVGVVVIGRNEGERLKLCLRSIPSGFPVAYVDSGSADGSVAFAHSMGVAVVELDTSIGFTAARARNAGWRALTTQFPSLKFIQFVDGDCELQNGWIGKAHAAMLPEATLAAVFGRRRERYPEKSMYNRMCDDEWNGPVGIVQSCGGDVLFRVDALQAANGYCDDLIAGEEPDLCLRLAREGWLIRRIDAEMTLHDADIFAFSSWWKRSKRSGFAYAQHVFRHREDAFQDWKRQTASILFWGFAYPTSILTLSITAYIYNPQFSLLIIFFGISIILAKALQIFRKKLKSTNNYRFSLHYTFLILVGKYAEFSGICKMVLSFLKDKNTFIIEYK